MALRDTAILLAYCFDNYNMIIDQDRTLDEIFFEIISKFNIKVNGTLNKYNKNIIKNDQDNYIQQSKLI